LGGSCEARARIGFQSRVRRASGVGAWRSEGLTAAKDGWHINVRDLTTGQSGTIVLDSKSDGPLMPTYDTQEVGNSLKWGAVHDTPDSFVWEIGHTSPFTSPGSQSCWPGEASCYSCDAEAWRDQSPPIHILNVTFANGSHPSSWAVVSDFGGKAEVLDPTETGSTCTSYGGPFCIYPGTRRTPTGRSAMASSTRPPRTTLVR
jgi:hypothetical protein